MRIAHDLFSETNPAFCAYNIAAFTTAFSTVNEEGPEIPLSYLALPIALSGNFVDTFEGTNKNTGLLEWLERNPQVHISFPELVNASLDIVTDAIRFGCFSNILFVGEGARLRLGSRKIKKSAVSSLSNGPAQSLKHAARLGYWFGFAAEPKQSLIFWM